MQASSYRSKSIEFVYFCCYFVTGCVILNEVRVTFEALHDARDGGACRQTTEHPPESWLRMQQAVDLWEVEQAREKLAGIKPIKAELQAA